MFIPSSSETNFYMQLLLNRSSYTKFTPDLQTGRTRVATSFPTDPTYGIQKTDSKNLEKFH